MKRTLAALLAACLLLTGCGFPQGSYVSVTPHQHQKQIPQTESRVAENYLDLMEALVELIALGTESATIHVGGYPANAVKSGMAVAIRYAMENDPIGAYAVEKITYELGSNGGHPAVAVQISYLHNQAEIRRIQRVDNMEEAERLAAKALENYDTGVVMLVKEYASLDFVQLVEDQAETRPHLIMEQPQVTAGIYGNGRERVVELSFTYRTGRDSLRAMRAQVEPVFESAVLYVSEDASQWQKYSQLYGFLMERFDYTVETSITPAYSLLHHGVGDSRAFAIVYAAMCRAAGLECHVVTGTCSGEPRVWNMICDNGNYYHVDLLRSNQQGKFQVKTDGQMQGYVWDYSSYPACTGHAGDWEEEPMPEPDVPEEGPEEDPARQDPEKIPES